MDRGSMGCVASMRFNVPEVEHVLGGHVVRGDVGRMAGANAE